MATNFFKTAIGAAAILALFTSCTQEETIVDRSIADNNQISFNVTTGRHSRADRYYNAASDIDKMKISAWVNPADGNGRPYFTTENLSLAGGEWKYDDSNRLRYWPNNGESLDFYAWVDHDSNGTSKECVYDWNGGSPRLTGVHQENALDMVDVLYAGTFSESKGGTNYGAARYVTLNYQHAFAQVGVSVQVTNPKVEVEVQCVELVNITESADFHFPTQSQEAYWDNPSPVVSDYITYNYLSEPISYSSGAVDLTANGHTFMVIPDMEYTECSPTDIVNDQVTEGTCIRLTCKVKNVHDGNVDGTTGESGANDIYILGATDRYDNIYIPVGFNWKGGNHYHYTIKIGEGNAGYNKDGQYSLVKVAYYHELEDWIDDPLTNDFDFNH